MKKVFVKDKNLENYDYNNLKLSILITQDGLSYSLLSVNESKYLALVSIVFVEKKNYLEEISEFFKTEDLFNAQCGETVVFISDNRQTLVPDVLFDKNKLNEIWGLNFIPDSNIKINFSCLPKSSNCIIFPVRYDLIVLLDSILKDYILLPSSFSFIESNFTRCKLSDEIQKNKIFVQVFEDYLDILLISDSRIKLFNSFTYRTFNDVLYFIVNVIEQLKLTPENCEVIFSGFIETDNISVINLRKFIPQVYFESQNVDFKYFFKFQEIAPHYFFNFLNG